MHTANHISNYKNGEHTGLRENQQNRIAGSLPAMDTTAHWLGFTVIELMLSVAMLSVLIAVAAPSLNTFLQRQSIATQTDLITSAFSTARSEALNRADDMTVCWNSGSVAITQKGYSIVAGNLAVLVGDTTDTVDEDTDVIADFAYGGDLFIVDDETDNCIVFNDQGRLNLAQVGGTTLVVGVCTKSGETENSRVITLSATGRATSDKNVAPDDSVTIACT